MQLKENARMNALFHFMGAAMPALIAKQRARQNPEEPGEAARLSADQIAEIATTAYEIADAALQVIAAGEAVRTPETI